MIAEVRTRGHAVGYAWQCALSWNLHVPHYVMELILSLFSGRAALVLSVAAQLAMDPQPDADGMPEHLILAFLLIVAMCCSARSEAIQPPGIRSEVAAQHGPQARLVALRRPRYVLAVALRCVTTLDCPACRRGRSGICGGGAAGTGPQAGAGV